MKKYLNNYGLENFHHRSHRQTDELRFGNLLLRLRFYQNPQSPQSRNY